jgi:ABC-type Mn2+/Zn2+ transport system permease subunit
VIIAAVTIVVAIGIALFYKELLLTSFDPNHAMVIGLSPDRVRYGLLILLALAIVTGIQTVGVVLISALLVTPAATAAIVTTRLPRMMVYAALISAAATYAGMLASYYYDVASGAAIVLTCTLLFTLTFLFAPRRGFLMRRRKLE